jgi:hypothetical protein
MWLCQSRRTSAIGDRSPARSEAGAGAPAAVGVVEDTSGSADEVQEPGA